MWFSTYSKPVAERIAEMQSGKFKTHPAYPLMVTGILLFSQGYFIWGLVLIHRYRKRIRNYFSKIENIDLAWLRFILITAIIAYAINSLLFLSDYFFNLFNYRVMQLYTFVIGALFILSMGFYGLRQTNVFYSGAQILSGNHRQKNNSGVQSKLASDEAFIHELLSYMNEQKPYLQPEITLNELSRQMNVMPEYLSGILNRQLNIRFFDFINQFRVEAFKDACQAPENANYSIIALAYDCGFNSKATFNRVFKNMTGTTPSEYQKKSAMKSITAL